MPYRTPEPPVRTRWPWWRRILTKPCEGCDDGIVMRWSRGTGPNLFNLCPLCINLAAADAMRHAAGQGLDEDEAGRALFASALYRRAIRKPYR